MNKKFIIIFIILSLIVILCSGGACVYFYLNAKELSSKLKSLKPDYERMLKDNEGLGKRFAEIEKKHNEVIEDRDNLLAQTKNLLVWKTKAEELKQAIEKTAQDIRLLEAEKQTLQDEGLKSQDELKMLKDRLSGFQDENKKFKDELSELKQAREQALKEKDRLKKAYERVLETNIPEEMGKKILSFQEENKGLSAVLKKIQAELNRVKKSEAKEKAELESLRNRWAQLHKDYVEAVKKNRELEQRLIQTPAKFSELARQNKTLIKESARMHYNLGVFYVKNKDYSRAISEFENALELNPNDAYAHFNLGYIYAEYLIDRPKSIDHFKNYLRLIKGDDKDVDWVKKYILTWQAWEGKEPMK